MVIVNEKNTKWVEKYAFQSFLMSSWITFVYGS